MNRLKILVFLLSQQEQEISWSNVSDQFNSGKSSDLWIRTRTSTLCVCVCVCVCVCQHLTRISKAIIWLIDCISKCPYQSSWNQRLYLKQTRISETFIIELLQSLCVCVDTLHTWISCSLPSGPPRPPFVCCCQPEVCLDLADSWAIINHQPHQSPVPFTVCVSDLSGTFSCVCLTLISNVD